MYEKMKNQLMNGMDYYDEMTMSYPWEEIVIDLHEQQDKKIDILYENAINVAENGLSRADTPDQIIVRGQLLIEYGKRLCAYAEVKKTLPHPFGSETKKEPLEANQDGSWQ